MSKKINLITIASIGGLLGVIAAIYALTDIRIVDTSNYVAVKDGYVKKESYDELKKICEIYEQDRLINLKQIYIFSKLGNDDKNIKVINNALRKITDKVIVIREAQIKRRIPECIEVRFATTNDESIARFISIYLNLLKIDVKIVDMSNESDKILESGYLEIWMNTK